VFDVLSTYQTVGDDTQLEKLAQNEGSLLNPVVGDAAKPLFGLAKAAFDELANCVDAICQG
jgi:thioester reductase-like protein